MAHFPTISCHHKEQDQHHLTSEIYFDSMVLPNIKPTYSDEPKHYAEKDEGHNTDYLITMVHVKVWDILDSNRTVSTHSRRVECGRNGQAWRPERLWQGPNRQTTGSEHLVQGRTNHKPATGGWAPKAHWCVSPTKAVPSGPNRQKSYCSTSHRNFV